MPGPPPDPRNAERIAKLPRWAHEMLAREREKRIRAEAKLAAHLETVDKTNIWYGEYTNPIYLPRAYGNQRVHFDLGEQGQIRDDMQVGMRGGVLEVMAGRALTIEPEVSNVIRLRFRDE